MKNIIEIITICLDNISGSAPAARGPILITQMISIKLNNLKGLNTSSVLTMIGMFKLSKNCLNEKGTPFANFRSLKYIHDLYFCIIYIEHGWSSKLNNWTTICFIKHLNYFELERGAANLNSVSLSAPGPLAHK